MLIAALVLALVAFLALVFYVVTAQTVALVALFVAAGLGIICFLVDWIRKARHDRRK